MIKRALKVLPLLSVLLLSTQAQAGIGHWWEGGELYGTGQWWEGGEIFRALFENVTLWAQSLL